MKYIIELPEEVKEKFDNATKDDIYGSYYDYNSVIGNAIKNGTPLPKGHGRLIDADSIYQIVKPIETSDAEWGMTAETAIRLIHDAFNKAPTIVEADKENKE